MNSTCSALRSIRHAHGNFSRARDETKLRCKQFSAVLAVLLLMPLAVAQVQGFADPAVSDARFTPDTISTGATATLEFTFVNAGSTVDPTASAVIPMGTVRLQICPSFSHYITPGYAVGSNVGQPYGDGTPKDTAARFTWSTIGNGCWRGVNNRAFDSLDGGSIFVTYTGIAASPTPQATNINIQLVGGRSLVAFNNRTSNDNVHPVLSVTPPLAIGAATTLAIPRPTAVVVRADAVPVPIAPFWLLALGIAFAAAFISRNA